VIDDAKIRNLTLAATVSATGAAHMLALVAKEGPVAAHGLFEDEPIEQLLDAAKMAIEAEVEACVPQDDERGQIYAALVRYLEGWFG